MRKLKCWIGNFCGSREACVVTTSQAKAAKIVGCGVGTFRQFYNQMPIPEGLRPDTLYTRPMWGCGYVMTGWIEGRCKLERDPRG